MMNALKKVTVFAPATSANVVVGFDILGFALAGLGDWLDLERSDQPGLIVSPKTL
jgi:homoserine kinase